VCRRRRLPAPLGHEGFVETVERLQPSLGVDADGLQQNAEPEAPNPDFLALEAEGAGQPDGLATAGLEELRGGH
jgi:hypothetical protein